MLECDEKCLDILRKTRRNPPPSTKVEIHTGYCKAKYVCRKGTDIRACRNGQWIGSKALKCPGEVRRVDSLRFGYNHSIGQNELLQIKIPEPRHHSMFIG